MADPYLEASDELEKVIDDAQADHLNGHLISCQIKLSRASNLVGKLMDLERKAADA